MSPSGTSNGRVILITGCSTGIGAALAQQTIDSGDIVVATARRVETLRFNGATEQNCLPLRVDLFDSDSLVAAFDRAVQTFGRVDVFINNAGYGLSGAFESLSDKDIRDQMEVNFFGALNGTRKALEVMRAQSPPGGNIVQVTSVGALVGFPLMSMYSASKFAVEGLIMAIAGEVKPEWNIHLTCVEPGGFRTDFFPRSMSYTEKGHPAYDHIDLRAAMKHMHEVQMGDPPKGARAIYDAAVLPNPPARLLLGTDAYDLYNGKLGEWSSETKRNESISLSTDVDAA